LLPLSIRHQARSGCVRAAQKNLQLTERYRCESRQLLMLQPEAQLLRVEIDGASDVANLIANAVKGESEIALGHVRSSGRGSWS